MRTRRSQSSGDPMSSGPSVAKAMEDRHRTVLLHEAVDSLAIDRDDIVVDATLGGAGHSVEMLKHLGLKGTLIGIDADAEAIERSRGKLGDTKATVYLVNANFRNLKAALDALGIKRITKALFDLGWSSYQLSAGRGFSFLTDEPLSMAYASEHVLTAGTIVNE